jgi:16S rRNA (guanine527-N7)-methyltransferase
VKHTDIADALAAYASLVRTWAPTTDLVSPGDLERFESRHIDDALRLTPLVESARLGPGVDVGSGVGIPGIPLAIATDRAWRLIEPRRKRAGFLEEVVRTLELDCEVLCLSAETAAGDPRLAGVHAIAVARALAPPEHAFRLLAPLVAPSGVAALLVGQDAELPQESREWARGIATMDREAMKRKYLDE